MEKDIDNQVDMMEEPEVSPFKYTRRSRTAEKREAESRSSNSRPAMAFETSSQFNIPESMLNDNTKQFGWSAYTIRNDEVPQNFDTSLNSGWIVAEASAYPQMKRIYKHDPFRNRSHDDEMIKRGGMIFMERDIEIKEAEDQHYDEKNYHDRKLTEIHTDPSSGLRVMTHSRTRSYSPR